MNELPLFSRPILETGEKETDKHDQAEIDAQQRAIDAENAAELAAEEESEKVKALLSLVNRVLPRVQIEEARTWAKRDRNKLYHVTRQDPSGQVVTHLVAALSRAEAVCICVSMDNDFGPYTNYNAKERKMK